MVGREKKGLGKSEGKMEKWRPLNHRKVGLEGGMIWGWGEIDTVVVNSSGQRRRWKMLGNGGEERGGDQKGRGQQFNTTSSLISCRELKGGERKSGSLYCSLITAGGAGKCGMKKRGGD